jgi:hypothetical protein
MRNCSPSGGVAEVKGPRNLAWGRCVGVEGIRTENQQLAVVRWAVLLVEYVPTAPTRRGLHCDCYRCDRVATGTLLKKCQILSLPPHSIEERYMQRR